MMDSSKPGASARFIPKDQLGAVQAWRFDDIAGLNKRAAKPPELDPKERAALDKGYRAGFEAGRSAGEKLAEQAMHTFHETTGGDFARRIHDLTESYESQLKHMEQALAGQVLELSLELARQLVRSELTTNPQSVQRVATEAVELMLAGNEIATLRLHPADLGAVADAMKPYLDSGKLKLLADPALSVGGCVVEAGLGRLDATTERRWAQVLANFGQAAPDVLPQDVTAPAVVNLPADAGAAEPQDVQ